MAVISFTRVNSLADDLAPNMVYFVANEDGTLGITVTGEDASSVFSIGSVPLELIIQAISQATLKGIVFDNSTKLQESDTFIEAFGKLQVQVSDKAPIDSPVLTGRPMAPTPDNNSNDNSIATTAFIASTGLLGNNVGSAPDRIPLNLLLGRMAFADKVMVLTTTNYGDYTDPGDIWIVKQNDRSITICLRGGDGIVRRSSPITMTEVNDE